MSATTGTPATSLRLGVWASAMVVMFLLVEVATGTSDGLRTDLGDVATTVPLAVRQLLLAAAQVGALLVPLVVLPALAARRRWRRLGTVVAAAAVGAAAVWLVGVPLDEPPAVPGALSDETWLLSTRFPSVAYLGGAVAAGVVGKPWLGRRWRRATDVSVVALTATMALCGSAGVPELLLAVAAGGVAGAAILVALGAPNRRPTPTSIVTALTSAGLVLEELAVERAVGGRAQLYRALTADGPTFLKVYAQDSRDADLLYRTYRTTILRDPGSTMSSSLHRDVEHEALLLLLAERGGVTCPGLRAIVGLPDGSMVLAMDDVGGHRLDELATADIGADLLDELWREVVTLHRAGLAHGALRTANVLVTDAARPTIIDFGAASAAAGARDQALDRAELITLARRRGRPRGGCRIGGTDARPVRPRRGDALPPAARPLRGDTTARLQVLVEGTSHTHRRGNGT